MQLQQSVLEEELVQHLMFVSVHHLHLMVDQCVNYQNVLESHQMTPQTFVLEEELVLLQIFVQDVEHNTVDQIVSFRFVIPNYPMTQLFVLEEDHALGQTHVHLA